MSLLVWLLLSWLLGERVNLMRRCDATIEAEVDVATKLCTDYGYILKEAQFAHEKHWLCLKKVRLGASSLASPNLRILVNPDINQRTHNTLKKEACLSHRHLHMVYGFPLENPDAGSAEGYIGLDRHFYGVLHLDGRTLYADPHGYDAPGLDHGQLHRDNLPGPPRARRHDSLAQLVDTFPYPPPFIIRHQPKRAGVASARICELLLLADKEFYERDANSSVDQVVMRMMHTVAQADIVFRNADFNEDGVPDNIGFSVKYILVLLSNATNSRVFGDLLNSKEVDGRSYLMKFARIRRLSDVCLGIAFSGHGFHNKTLGLSFTSLGGSMAGAAGGLCDRRAYGRSFNTLALAHLSHAATRLPERIAALTLAHEMGHSFGAHHDDNFENPECRGFLMGSHSSTRNISKHYEFSTCSKRLIAPTLASMSYCLVEEDRPYCGNGIVEEGEACDCGLPSQCSERDPCCTPRGGGALIFAEGALHREGCSVAPAAECHPSQGRCCDAKCKFVNLKRYGIHCEYQTTPCACDADDSALCRCGLGGRCRPDGTCHAAECARLGLDECRCEAGKQEKEPWCTSCCRLGTNATGSCVPAASAASWTLVESARDVPDDWADEDYVGPNITVRLCPAGPHLTLRAWPPDAPCVTRNEVGVCDRRGVCSTIERVPRTNVFPRTMGMRLSASEQAGLSSAPQPPTSWFKCILIPFILLLCRIF